MSCVPLPWCTSQSTIATRSSPSSACAQRAAIAIESKRQKPIARSRSAWWPGGRASAKPPRRTASIAAPAASSAASNVVSVQIVSASSQPRVVAHALDERRRVAAQHVGLRRRRALDEREALVQHGDPLPATPGGARSGGGARSARGLRARSHLRSRVASRAAPRIRKPRRRHRRVSIVGSRYGLVMPRALWAKAPLVLLQHWCDASRSRLLGRPWSRWRRRRAAASCRGRERVAEGEARRATPLGAGLTIETKPAPGRAHGPAGARRRATRARARRRQAPDRQTTGRARSVDTRSKAASRSTSSRWRGTTRAAHVRLVQGGGRRCPRRPFGREVARVTPGGTLQLVLGRRTRGRPTRLPVGAVYLTLDSDRDNPYWVNFAL